MSDYREIARRGKNDWWRYVLSFPSIISIWLVMGSLPVVALMAYVQMDADPTTSFSGTGFTGVPRLLQFLVTMSSFIPFLGATLLAVRFLHERRLKTLITAADRIRWKRIFSGAAVWFCISVLIASVEAFLYPGRYVLTFQPVALLLFAVFALIFVPIQVAAEEVFFRGYLLQWMGLRIKNKWLLSLLNGILFFLPHAANPEMATNSLLVGLGYFAIGFFFALITLQDNGMELALGAHTANNLFVVLFANYATSALPSPALFTIQVLDPVYGLIALVIGMIIFCAVFFRPIRSETVTLPE